jgi:hypothetical protein
MAFLTMRSDRQLVATSGNGFGLFEPFARLSHLRPVATGCARSAPQLLHPLSSLEATRRDALADLDPFTVREVVLPRYPPFAPALLHQCFMSVRRSGASDGLAATSL